MTFYQCSVCDYIYREENYEHEDNENFFLKLPEDWRCPGCGSSKESFIYVQSKKKEKIFENNKISLKF